MRNLRARAISLLVLGVFTLRASAWFPGGGYADSDFDAPRFEDHLGVDSWAADMGGMAEEYEPQMRQMVTQSHPRARRLRRNENRQIHNAEYGVVEGDIYHDYRPYYFWYDRVRVELYHKSVDGSERFLGGATSGQTGYYYIDFKWRVTDPELRRPNLFIRSYLLRYGRFVPLYTSPVFQKWYIGERLKIDIDLSKCRNCGQQINSYSNIEAGAVGAEAAAAAGLQGAGSTYPEQQGPTQGREAPQQQGSTQGRGAPQQGPSSVAERVVDRIRSGAGGSGQPSYFGGVQPGTEFPLGQPGLRAGPPVGRSGVGPTGGIYQPGTEFRSGRPGLRAEPPVGRSGVVPTGGSPPSTFQPSGSFSQPTAPQGGAVYENAQPAATFQPEVASTPPPASSSGIPQGGIRDALDEDPEF